MSQRDKKPSRKSKKSFQARRRRLRSKHSYSLSFEALEDRKLLAALTVNTASDRVDGNTQTITSLINDPGVDNAISLREAIFAVNNTPGTDAISFDANVFNGEAQDVIRIELAFGISESVVIDAGDLGVVISGDRNGNDSLVSGTFVTDPVASLSSGSLDDNSDQVIRVTADLGEVVTLDGLTVTGGRSHNAGGGIDAVDADLIIRNSSISGNFAEELGGGLAGVFGDVTIEDSVVDGNVVSGSNVFGGGGIFVYQGDVSLSNSSVSGNVLEGRSSSFSVLYGGGIVSDRGAVTLTDSTVSENVIKSNVFEDAVGGGISVRDGSAVTLTRSTISGNLAEGDAAKGGGINVTSRELTLVSSTISGNAATSFNFYGRSNGGGIYSNSSTISIVDSTVTENSAYSGGGIELRSFSSDSITLSNSIFAGNTAIASGDLEIDRFSGTIFDVSFSLIGDGTGSGLNSTFGTIDFDGNIVGDQSAPIDPLLADLADNGGSTLTHALLPGSFAINTGNSLSNFDQRGEARVIGSPLVPSFFAFSGNGSDIGAFEFQSSFILVNDSRDFLNGNFPNGTVTLREAISIVEADDEFDAVFFDPGVFNGEAQDVIRLQSELLITESITIDGGDLGIVISGDTNGDDSLVAGTFITDVSNSLQNVSDNTQVFNVLRSFSSNEVVTLSGLTITGGNSITSGGGVQASDTSVVLNDSIVSGNQAADGGGGISTSYGDLTLVGSVVEGNLVRADQSGGIGFGGGISAGYGNVMLTDSTVSGNAVGSLGSNARYVGGGGVAASRGDLTLTRSTVHGNSLLGDDSKGGGVITYQSNVSLVSSTVSENLAGSSESSRSRGGGIHSINTVLTLTGSTVNGNRVEGLDAHGGGIDTDNGSLTLLSSTVSGNAATSHSIIGRRSEGGGIYSNAQTNVIVDSTITRNEADVGGGISVNDLFAASSLELNNSIVAANTATDPLFEETDDIDIGFFSVSLDASSSLIGSGDHLPGLNTTFGIPDANGNLVGDFFAPVDPLLAGLADNGGPTLTHSLLPISPAINAGNSDLEFDQRGEARTAGEFADIGASELQASFVLVDNSGDTFDGDFSQGEVTLREAIVMATFPEEFDNLSLDTNTVFFDPRVFNGEAQDVIRLDSTLLIEHSVTIDGGDLGVVITGDRSNNDMLLNGTFITDTGASDSIGLLTDNVRPFDVLYSGAASSVVTFKGLTITGGNTRGFGGAINNEKATIVIEDSLIAGNLASSGAGIYTNAGNVSLINAAVSDNGSFGNDFGFDLGDGRGGGIATRSGNITLAGSTVSGNASEDGGGIHTCFGTVTVSGSTISGNSAYRGDGGGIFSAYGLVTVTDSTISENRTLNFSSSGGGGGIRIVRADLSVSNSTISGNVILDSGDGGGILSDYGSTTIENSTITANRIENLGNGGGLAQESFNGSVSVRNSIIAGNFSAFFTPDIANFGNANFRFSLIGSSEGFGLAPTSPGFSDFAGNFVGSSFNPIDPRLGALADNGGPTLTHALLPGSLAIDAGDPNFNGGLETDQTGADRVADGRLSIGAIEAVLGSTVVGRHLFYNDSAFDFDNVFASSADDNAIATNKTALLAGETSTYDNVSNYIHGINGIIVDAFLADATAFSADDIVLSAGIGNQQSDFTLLDVTPEISVRAGEGVDGSDRITIILPNGSVTNEFLQVQVLANANTGLAQNDVFYFGSVVGDTGNRTTDTLVDGADVLKVQANLTPIFQSENVESDYDINRDGQVDGADVLLIQANLSPILRIQFLLLRWLILGTSK